MESALHTIAPEPDVQPGEHILFLDDDQSILKSLRRMLLQKKLGWRYSFAASVKEALDILEESSVDVLVSDIRMPDRDGFHMLKSLREDTRWDAMPVVMCTALESPHLKTKAMELGAIDLIHKPIKPSEMVARLKTILAERQKLVKFKERTSFYRNLLLEHSRELEASKVEMILRLAKAAEYRSSEDPNHVVRVGYYSKLIADRLGLERSFSDQIFVTSPLHDIGKIAIPDSTLLKEGKYTEKEMAIMRCHCELGYDLLGPNRHSRQTKGLNVNKMVSVVFNLYEYGHNHLLESAAEIALSHHEWWDGSGYPYGKRGEQIPLSGRIVSIADTYDALRTERFYKPAYSHAEALGIMRSEHERHFDPKIFKVFEECNEEIAQIFP